MKRVAAAPIVARGHRLVDFPAVDMDRVTHARPGKVLATELTVDGLPVDRMDYAAPLMADMHPETWDINWDCGTRFEQRNVMCRSVVEGL